MPHNSLIARMPEIPLTRTRTVNGLHVRFLEWGAYHERTLVLLHGGGQSAWTWQRVAAALAPRYRLIAPDLRGHGDTAWSPDGVYSLERFRDDLHGLVRTLKLGRFVLVGMSLGGMTALAYAGAHGATLDGLVVVDIAPEVERAGRERLLAFLKPGQSFGSLDEVVEHAHAFNPRRSKEVLRQTLPRNLRRGPDGSFRWKWDPACFNFTERGEWEGQLAALWEAAAHVPCPALVVHGEASDVLSRDAGERLAQTAPRGEFVTIVGAGHSVQGDNPHSLSDALTRFLDSIGY
jgi:pimeloyl-ACP methyl ester carboxylesterase